MFGYCRSSDPGLTRRGFEIGGEQVRSFGYLAALALAAATSARAEWRQARTDHFVLTIDDSEEGARDFATRLERFDGAMRRLYGVADGPDLHARPIAINAFKPDLFNQVCRCPGVLGFYQQRVEGSLIYSVHMPEVDRKSKTGWWSSQTVLLHEYSHHFAFSSFPIAYPYWFSEGFAEFNANASFEDDGSTVVGYPANYRAESLQNGNRLSPKQLFDPHRYGFGENIDLVYGRGWLLTHHLMLNPHRGGQLGAYLATMNKGKPSLVAAESAFGDLKALDKELDTYRRGRLASPLRVAAAAAPVGVTMTTLTPGQAAMLPVHALMTNGVAKGHRLGVAMRAAKVAARHPEDAVVQAQRAEVEYHAGRLDQADAAANAALKLRPDLVDALVRKGMIAVRRARDAKAADPAAGAKGIDSAAWTAARAWFLKANRANPNAVMPLYLYYTSFAQAQAKPTPGAIKGLMRAEVLAPESSEVRTALARQMLIDGDAATARALLQPIAFAPHRRRTENVPRQIVDLIDAGRIEDAKAAMAKAEADALAKRD